MANYPINGELIKALRNSQSIGLGDLASILDLTSDKLREIEGEISAEISFGRIKKLTELFGVSEFDLSGSDNSLVSVPLPDFRTTDNRPAKVSVVSWKRIHAARSLQEEIDEIIQDAPHLGKGIEFEVPAVTNDVTGLATKIRDLIDLNWEYQSADEKPLSVLNYTRAKIEQLGVFVVQMSYPLSDSRGFCLTSDDTSSDLIVLNTKLSSQGARVFTLIHELVHVLMRQPGLSDFTRITNDVERFCNSVAAEVLMPSEELSDFVGAYVENRNLKSHHLRNISKKIGVSQYSLAIRLTEIGLVAGDFVSKWLASLPADAAQRFSDGELDPQESEEDEIRRSSVGGGRLAKIGLGIGSLALTTLDNRLRGEIDLYRSFQIKPQHLGAIRKALSTRLEVVQDIGGK